jgi:hypothetical protein
VHGVAATRACHQLIDAHNGHTNGFAPAMPSHPRAIFPLYDSRHPHSERL